MKKLIVIKIIMLIALVAFMGSCRTATNICKANQVERISGNLLYAYPSKMYDCRTIVLGNRDTKRKDWVYVFNVPLDQPTTNIPVCKFRGSYYWVMP